MVRLTKETADEKKSRIKSGFDSPTLRGAEFRRSLYDTKNNRLSSPVSSTRSLRQPSPVAPVDPSTVERVGPLQGEASLRFSSENPNIQENIRNEIKARTFRDPGDIGVPSYTPTQPKQSSVGQSIIDRFAQPEKDRADRFTTDRLAGLGQKREGAFSSFKASQLSPNFSGTEEERMNRISTARGELDRLTEAGTRNGTFYGFDEESTNARRMQQLQAEIDALENNKEPPKFYTVSQGGSFATTSKLSPDPEIASIQQRIANIKGLGVGGPLRPQQRSEIEELNKQINSLLQDRFRGTDEFASLESQLSQEERDILEEASKLSSQVPDLAQSRYVATGQREDLLDEAGQRQAELESQRIEILNQRAQNKVDQAEAQAQREIDALDAEKKQLIAQIEREKKKDIEQQMEANKRFLTTNNKGEFTLDAIDLMEDIRQRVTDRWDDDITKAESDYNMSVREIKSDLRSSISDVGDELFKAEQDILASRISRIGETAEYRQGRSDDLSDLQSKRQYDRQIFQEKRLADIEDFQLRELYKQQVKEAFSNTGIKEQDVIQEIARVSNIKNPQEAQLALSFLQQQLQGLGYDFSMSDLVQTIDNRQVEQDLYRKYRQAQISSLNRSKLSDFKDPTSVQQRLMSAGADFAVDSGSVQNDSGFFDWVDGGVSSLAELFSGGNDRELSQLEEAMNVLSEGVTE